MGWLIALGALVILAALPLGVGCVYDQSGLVLRLLIGPFSIRLYPGKAGKEAQKQEKSPETKKTVSQNVRQKKGGALSDLLPLIEIAFDFLGDLRRKLRVKMLDLQLTLAGGDPCDLAVNYGRAWAAVGNLMPMLEHLFVIKKRNVDVQCDFMEDRTLIYLRLDLTITVGRLLTLVTRYGIRTLRALSKNAEIKKGGAVK